MNVLISIVILILQFVAAQILGFGGATALGVGNGWELVVIPIGNVLGINLVGGLAAVIRRQFSSSSFLASLIGSAVGGGLGAIIILLTPATGFSQLLYPLLGALIGYYIPNFIGHNRNNA